MPIGPKVSDKWTFLAAQVEARGWVVDSGGGELNLRVDDNFAHLVKYVPGSMTQAKGIHCETYPDATRNWQAGWSLPDKGAPWYQGGTDKTFFVREVNTEDEYGTLWLQPNDKCDPRDNSRGWTVTVYLTPPHAAQPTQYGPFGPVFDECDYVDTGVPVPKGSTVGVTSTGKVDFGGAVLGIGAPVLDADGDDWAPDYHYPAPNLRKNSLICRVDNWAFRVKDGDAWRDLQQDDYVRITGFWVIENGHLQNVRSNGAGQVFVEFHPVDYKNIQLIKPLNPGDTAVETVTVAAPLYEEVFPYPDWRLYINDDGSNFHNTVSATAQIIAPPPPAGFPLRSNLVRYEEVTLRNDMGLPVEEVRSIRVLDGGIIVTATISAPLTETVDGFQIGDINHPTVFQARYSVSWKRRLVVSPESIRIGVEAVGDSRDFEVILMNYGSAKVKILSYAFLPDALQSVFHVDIPTDGTFVVDPWSQKTFKVTFSPNQTGNFSGTLVLVMDGALPQEYYEVGNPQVGLTGVVPAFPQLTVRPTDHDFMGVVLGDGETFDFQVSNTGLVPLNVQPLSPLATPFSIVTGLPAQIGIGETKPLTVEFAPVQTGDYTAAITVNSNAPAPSSVTLHLRGRGVRKAKDKDHKEQKDKDALKEHAKDSDVPSLTLRGNEPASRDSPAGLADRIEGAGASRRAFIRPGERPVVGEAALVQPDEPPVG